VHLQTGDVIPHDNYHYHQMLSSPACSAFAAKLAGEKYDMDDAFVDFLHGVADDFGTGLLKSESLLGNLFGLVVLGTNYGVKLEKARACTNSFVEHFYGPKLVWQQRVKEIRLEPQAIKNNCERLIVRHNDYLEKLNVQETRLQNIRAQYADIDVIHHELASRAVSNPFCSNAQSTAKTDDGLFTRYLIGVMIENIEISNKNKEGGVLVTALTDNSPAKVAGVKKEDKIISINSVPIKNMVELMREVQKSSGQEIALMLARGNEVFSTSVKPTFKKVRISN